jgi:Uma2 family endonuclease
MKQYRGIVTLQGNLDLLYRDDPDVFVAGDLLWYPVEGDNKTRLAPDVMVAFGRPKGDRGSYRQWEEGGTPPQVVFEVLSPGNRPSEMLRKFRFYDRFGVEEYYIYDPDTYDFSPWVRTGDRLRFAEYEGSWTSPRLGVRFEPNAEAEMAVHYPDGRRFLTFVELGRARLDAEQRATDAEERAERLAARLRELGIDPEAK